MSGVDYDGTGFVLNELEVFTVISETTIPEPSGVALLGLGFLGLATVRRKSTGSKRA